MAGRLSTRLYAFLRKADFQREFDSVLKRIEDEIDAASVATPSSVPGFLYNCTPEVMIGDLVYIKDDDLVDRASGEAEATAPAVGLVRSKPSSTQAIIVYGGEMNGFSGLMKAQTYYLSADPGQVTLVPPMDPGGVVQKIGFARSSTTLVLRMDRDFTVI